MDIEDFYAADARRRSSEEIELGTGWRGADGRRYELSWVADTGELYSMSEPSSGAWVDPLGEPVAGGQVATGDIQVEVLGRVGTREELDRLLEGWQQAMATRNGLDWVRARLAARP